MICTARIKGRWVDVTKTVNEIFRITPVSREELTYEFLKLLRGTLNRRTSRRLLLDAIGMSYALNLDLSRAAGVLLGVYLGSSASLEEVILLLAQNPSGKERNPKNVLGIIHRKFGKYSSGLNPQHASLKRFIRARDDFKREFGSSIKPLFDWIINLPRRARQFLRRPRTEKRPGMFDYFPEHFNCSCTVSHKDVVFPKYGAFKPGDMVYQVVSKNVRRRRGKVKIARKRKRV